MPEAFSPSRISRTQSLRRRCSNYFTPKSKRTTMGGNRERAASIRTPSTRRPSVSRRTSLSTTPLKDSPKAFVSGPGRLIPVKQGYMYKRSGTSRMYRRKYVTLCEDSVLTYWPSFQAYVDNVEGKEIQLSHVTVKVPGRPPTGVRTAEEEDPSPLSLALALCFPNNKSWLSQQLNCLSIQRVFVFNFNKVPTRNFCTFSGMHNVSESHGKILN